MTSFFMASSFLDTWIIQNDGFIEDVAEGSLLDNMLVSTKNGIALIEEYAVTAWTSKYKVTFQRKQKNEKMLESIRNMDKLYDTFYKRYRDYLED